MATQCPHDKLTLQVAMLSACRKIEAYEKEHGEGAVMNKLESSGLSAPESGADLNKQTAEHHGITVDQLINSPNYEKLKEEFGESSVHKVIQYLKTEFGMDSAEAWAIIMQSQLT